MDKVDKQKIFKGAQVIANVGVEPTKLVTFRGIGKVRDILNDDRILVFCNKGYIIVDRIMLIVVFAKD